ncbi:MAG: hypothetical protein KGL01_00435 [Betaproteobacteria bacterium]|nr:hypothetical protein [Betaproteobacteria bacterium]
MRDDFSQKVKDTLGRRVGFVCANPDCGMLTVGPNSESSSSTNIGVAAHITAASPGGPRYDASLSETALGAVENGILLCQSCAKLIDSDVNRFPVELLRQWKGRAEKIAAVRLNKQLKDNEWSMGSAGIHEVIQENGYYEKQMEGYKIRYFLSGNLLHVEQELSNGSIGYYVIDSKGNMVEQKFPFPLSEYSVEFEPNIVLQRQKANLSDGTVREDVLMKWGKRAVIIWDSSHLLKDLHCENGVRIDHIRKVFIFEPPEFKSSIA